MALETLIIAIIVVCLLFYLVRYIPDAMVQRIATLILVVVSVLWLIRNLNAILHLRI